MLGQAKELNELLKQYVFNDFLWKEYPPVALQPERELVIPYFISLDSIRVIKWQDIDSIRIFDRYNGTVRITLYGKVVKYQAVVQNELADAAYFARMYRIQSITDSVYIPLRLKTHGEDPPLTDSIRKQFRNSLYQLNNVQVTECYRQVIKPLSFDFKTKEIVYCPDCDRYKGDGFFDCKLLKKATGMRLRSLGLDNKAPVIKSMEIYFTGIGQPVHIIQVGGIFNAELLKVLKNIQPGTSVIFDQVKVEYNGVVRTILSPGFIAQ